MRLKLPSALVRACSSIVRLEVVLRRLINTCLLPKELPGVPAKPGR